jgi:hypothetical protein
MHVAQLLNPLALRPDVEVIESRLPHMLRSSLKQGGLLGRRAPLLQNPLRET